MSKETPETLKVNSLAEIKKRLAENVDGAPVQLPSGLVFQLRKPSISKLLRDNVFPQELIASAIKLDAGKDQTANKEDYLKAIQVMEEVVYQACVFPKIARTQDEMTEDSILLSTIDDQDKVAIFLYVQTGVKPLNSFREQ